MQCGLASFLFYLHHQMVLHPLEQISLTMPSDWADALGWCLVLLPLTPMVVAAGASIVGQVVSREGAKVCVQLNCIFVSYFILQFSMLNSYHCLHWHSLKIVCLFIFSNRT